MGERDTLLNASIGAAIGVFAFFIPLSSLVGGLVAGHLEGGPGADGLRVGAISGVLQLVGSLALGFVVFLFFSATLAGNGGAALLRFGLFSLLGFAFVGGIYFVVLSAAGGWLVCKGEPSTGRRGL